MQMAEAHFKLLSPSGERMVPTEQFFIDLLTTALGPDELLAEIHVEVPPARTGTAYMKVFQKASGFAIVGGLPGSRLGADGRGVPDGTCRHYRRGGEVVPGQRGRGST